MDTENINCGERITNRPPSPAPEGQAEYWIFGPGGWRCERRTLRLVDMESARAGRLDDGEVVVLRGRGIPAFDAPDPDVLAAFLNRIDPAPF